MYRRAYTLLVGNAVVMGGLAILVAIVYHRHLVDPDGSFLGPSYLRLPLLLGGAVLIDLLPRALWLSKGRVKQVPDLVRERLRSHWTKERLGLVWIGIGGFYIIYVSYRNLKSFLPDVLSNRLYDHDLNLIDRTIFFGHQPGAVLQDLLGTGISGDVLSYVYLWFLPLVPVTVTIWVVWSRNLSYGYWFVTAQGIAWTLGTASYYALPTLGPGIAYAYVYSSRVTPANKLMGSLVNTRQHAILPGVDGLVQSIAGFASLHCAITLLMALMVTYTLRWRWLKYFFWVNFALTIVATIYFGWHYISDDVAGIMIAFVSFYFGGLASGQKFERKGRVSRSTTETSAIPVDPVVRPTRRPRWPLRPWGRRVARPE